MKHIHHTLEVWYCVLSLVSVGVALRLRKAYMQGVKNMRKPKSAVESVVAVVAGAITATTGATPVTVAKVVLAVAGIKPPEFINLETNNGVVAYKVPLHVKGACSKRALATALHNAIMRKGYTSEQAESLGSRLFVICGGLWVADNSDATGHVAIGECKGNKGATGYVKASKAWWTAQANVSKADSLLPQVAALVDYLCIDANGNADYAQAVVRTELACNKYRDTYKAFTDKVVEAPSM